MQRKMKVKLEYVDDSLYQVYARYVEIDHEPYVMEMIKQLDMDSLIDPQGGEKLIYQLTGYTDKLYEDRDTDMVLYANSDTVWQIPYNNTYIKDGEENIESGYVIILKNADGVYVCADFLNDEFGYVYKAFEAPYSCLLYTSPSPRDA